MDKSLIKQLDMAPRSKGLPNSIAISSSSMGRYYVELMAVGARTSGSTITSYAGGVLKQGLTANEERIKHRVQHAARIWGCDFDEAWKRLVEGEDLLEEGDK
jgi:hypothetical protein